MNECGRACVLCLNTRKLNTLIIISSSFAYPGSGRGGSSSSRGPQTSLSRATLTSSDGGIPRRSVPLTPQALSSSPLGSPNPTPVPLIHSPGEPYPPVPLLHSPGQPCSPKALQSLTGRRPALLASPSLTALTSRLVDKTCQLEQIETLKTIKRDAEVVYWPFRNGNCRSQQWYVAPARPASSV